LAFSQLSAATYVVTNTGDSGPGSLRQALLDANSSTGSDDIDFNIPTTDPGFNPTTGVWTLQPKSALPALADYGARINGATQTSKHGDTNIWGPEIELDGSLVVAELLNVTSSANEIRGLIINRAKGVGILIKATTKPCRENHISGNYIGTDATGKTSLGNLHGIMMYTKAVCNIIGSGNLISGNQQYGIYISDKSDSNIVQGNLIGTDRTGLLALGNGYGGIMCYRAHRNQIGGNTALTRNILSGTLITTTVHTGNGISLNESNDNRIMGNFIGTDQEGKKPIANISHGVVVFKSTGNVIGGLGQGDGNLISGNTRYGVFIRPTSASQNTVSGNKIGTDISGELELKNKSTGVYLDYGARNNMIGPNNIISYNAGGITCTGDTTFNNSFSMNQISRNTGKGINILKAGNKGVLPPIITTITTNYVDGTVTPNARIEIFSDSEDEGARFEGTTTADASGQFRWYGKPLGPFVTATATDADANTSEFSQAVKTAVMKDTAPTLPRGFALEQNYPNPFNASTRINYTLTKSSPVRLQLFDRLGRIVTTLSDQPQGPGAYSVMWNGNNIDGVPAAAGTYFCKLEQDQLVRWRKLVLLR
jgi:hypothetical protein